jgi:hypothetical protein
MITENVYGDDVSGKSRRLSMTDNLPFNTVKHESRLNNTQQNSGPTVLLHVH